LIALAMRRLMPRCAAEAGDALRLNNLPGNVDGAVYGVYVIGRGGYLSAGAAQGIDLSKGSTATPITIKIR